jgi:hypothetical protein
MEKIQKYDEFNKLNEFNETPFVGLGVDKEIKNKPMSGDETDEFDSFGAKFLGIVDITLWFGYNKKDPKNKIIKISNIKNEYNGLDCFDMSIETLETNGYRNKDIITDDILEQIKEIVIKNRVLLNEYSDGFFLMSEFMDRFVSNKKRKKLYNVRG